MNKSVKDASTFVLSERYDWQIVNYKVVDRNLVFDHEYFTSNFKLVY